MTSEGSHKPNPAPPSASLTAVGRGTLAGFALPPSLSAGREASAGFAALAPSMAVVTGLGCYALLGGFTSFLGWAIDVPVLSDWDMDGIAIQPNAALAAVLSGVAL